MNPARCRTTGKVRYHTHAKAMLVLTECTRQRRLFGKVYRQERRVYLCEHCDTWYLTSQP